MLCCVQSPYGGAINGQEEGGFVKVRSCRFFNNSASDKGAAIHVETRSHLLDVRDSDFDSNIVSGRPEPLTLRCNKLLMLFVCWTSPGV